MLGGGLLNNTGADQPAQSAALLFAVLKVSYVNLLQVNFEFSS